MAVVARNTVIHALAAIALGLTACGRIGFDETAVQAGRSRRLEVVGAVTGTLARFPLLVRWDADAAVADVVAAGQDQVAFEDDAGVALPYELEHFDRASGAVTAWVRADIATGTL